MAEVLLDEGWTPLNFDDPRCPICGAEMVIAETDRDETRDGVEYGWVAVYCTAKPEEHIDATLQYRRTAGE